MSLDLNKLENKLDEALSNETSELLNEWLGNKRMSNTIGVTWDEYGNPLPLTGEINNPDTTDNTVTTGQNNTGTYPEPKQIWLHYKGGRYEIIAMCNHTTTNEVMVIYKSLSFNGFHARPYSEWHDEVWEGNHRKTRFVLV
jgi:hypothetical protein